MRHPTLSALLFVALIPPATLPGQNGKTELTALSEQARNLHRTGQLTQAAQAYEKAVAQAKRSLGENDIGTANVLRELASVYDGLREHGKAERLYRQCLAIQEVKLGKNHTDVAWTLHSLAHIHMGRREYGKADPLYQRSLRIFEARLGKDHAVVAAVQLNLARMYKSMGLYDKAEPLLRRSLAIREAAKPRDDLAVADSLDNLAWLHWRRGEYARAEPLFKRCLAIREARLDKNHYDISHVVTGLAKLYEMTGEYAKAEPLYKRALAIRDVHKTTNPFAAGTGRSDLAGLYVRMRRYELAEPLLERSLEILEGCLGKDHPDVTGPLHTLGVVSEGAGDSAKAARYFDRARRNGRRHTALVLPTLSAAEQVRFLRMTVESGIHASLSFGLSHRGDPERVELSAGWLINNKGMAHEALTQSTRMARESSDPALEGLSRQLLQTRQQLAHLTLTPARSGEEANARRRMDQLLRQEQDLTRRLNRLGASAAYRSWVELSEVRAGLPRDAVLIDVARFNLQSFRPKPGVAASRGARYAAWITPRVGAVRAVDLGPAKAIDDAVRQVRKALDEASSLIRGKGEVHAEQALRAPLLTLSKLVLHPLLPHVGSATRWVVSPDGQLCLAPWEALLLPDGKYAIEAHQVSYLSSGRDLAPRVLPKVRTTSPLVLADPDFDLLPADAAAETRRILGRPDADTGTRSIAGMLKLGAIKRLPGTAAEARAIAPALRAYTKETPRVFTGKSALKGVFQSVRSPRVLVMCTHGFFLPDREASAAAVQNPLLRCGLLLAGCNHSGPFSSPAADGVLTGLEVVSADLRGCELVVLSACDTGVGEVRNGEGVAGLRQAFQLAGAQTVVSTLWQVPDRESAQLMSLFFTNLSKGQAKAEALREAQLRLLKERRDDKAVAHPFFWAAFTLTGAV